MLTAAQQDYLEVVYHLQENDREKKLRITDIAKQLGTRLPTVTRMVRKLTDLGYLNHESHGGVELTPLGKKTAHEIVHLHNDLMIFFTNILGLTTKQAEDVTCQVEHGFSPLAAERMHEFLLYYKSMSSKDKKLCQSFLDNASRKPLHFKNLSSRKTTGWRK